MGFIGAIEHGVTDRVQAVKNEWQRRAGINKSAKNAIAEAKKERNIVIKGLQTTYDQELEGSRTAYHQEVRDSQEDARNIIDGARQQHDKGDISYTTLSQKYDGAGDTSLTRQNVAYNTISKAFDKRYQGLGSDISAARAAYLKIKRGIQDEAKRDKGEGAIKALGRAVVKGK